MNYYVYKVTNSLNSKYYIGVHKTDNPADSYMGSGTAITRATAKYGKESFDKEILFETNDKNTAYDKERELIGDRWETDPLCYNMMPGGHGGFEHIDLSGDNNPMRDPEVVKRVAETKRANGSYRSEKNLSAWRNSAKLGAMARKGTKDSEETKSKRNASVKEAHQRPEVREAYLKAMKEKRSHFRLVDPEGNEHIVDNITEWCKEHHAPLSTITTKDDGEEVRRGRLRGWKIWRTKN